ncbi:hypothetical protein ROBYS_24440 [Roseobacter sp. OBYS 0001]|nr:hypothetical protein ROBYS_24440 [Roseobacter sp. OBYS 0001]
MGDPAFISIAATSRKQIYRHASSCALAHTGVFATNGGGDTHPMMASRKLQLIMPAAVEFV